MCRKRCAVCVCVRCVCVCVCVVRSSLPFLLLCLSILCITHPQRNVCHPNRESASQRENDKGVFLTCCSCRASRSSGESVFPFEEDALFTFDARLLFGIIANELTKALKPKQNSRALLFSLSFFLSVYAVDVRRRFQVKCVLYESLSLKMKAIGREREVERCC